MDKEWWIEHVEFAVNEHRRGNPEVIDNLADMLVQYDKIEQMIRKEALSHGHGCAGVVEWLIKMEKAYQYDE